MLRVQNCSTQQGSALFAPSLFFLFLLSFSLFGALHLVFGASYMVYKAETEIKAGCGREVEHALCNKERDIYS
jgi:hypothetical protein